MSAKSPAPPADVCVVGSCNADLVARVPRLPAAGETLVGSSLETFLGGKGFNQAVAAARSGAATAMVARLGDDDFGRQFIAALAAEGIDGTQVTTTPGCATGITTISVDDAGQNTIVLVPGANRTLMGADVATAATMIGASRVVLLQLELSLDVVVEAARVAHAGGAVVVLNPAPAVASLAPFRGFVDYVVPNEGEAAALTGVACDDGTVGRVADALTEQTGARGIVLTLGGRGAVAVTSGEVHRVPPYAVPVVDTVGAGDAFCGAMATALARGAGLGEAVRYGNAAGALAVTKAGAEPSMPRRADIERLLAES